MTVLDFVGIYDCITRLKSMGFMPSLTWEICALSDHVSDDHGLRIASTWTRRRLETSAESDFARPVEDPDFGRITVLDVWSGVVTSFAWHAGQIALLAKLLPDTPVSTMEFGYWKKK
ncbi:MAG: hypothetical protein IH804_04825 [Planctomycetes bacterium]|nr:hypothetical protein [Planctomycetota bacterium]